MAARLTTLCAAPLGEAYSGPVLFEGEAAAQLLAQMLGGNLSPVRSPISEPGRPVNLPPSDFEGRLGARVMPEFLDITDDPFARDSQGRPLFGYYPIDMEGVVPQPLPIVRNGVLKNFLLTRQPVRGFEGSNGRARLPGGFGASTALPSNLLVTARETVPLAALKTKLLDAVRQRNKPYGLIVRKIDFPSSASVGELRRLASSLQAGGGSSRPVSLPLAVYRVYPDGREEPVRGMRFRGLTVRALRDIVAASTETHSLNLLLNSYPLALMGAGGFVTGVSVVTPSLLFDELDLDRPQEERPSAPLVPPPPLEGED
jgi:predicted Zn-dependent protease